MKNINNSTFSEIRSTYYTGCSDFGGILRRLGEVKFCCKHNIFFFGFANGHVWYVWYLRIFPPETRDSWLDNYSTIIIETSYQ